MKKGLETARREDRRLRMLQILAGETPRSSTTTTLLRAVHLVGHRVTRARLDTDLAWLEERDLVAVDDPSDDIRAAIGDKVRLVRLLERGQECARGHAVVPGVARPEI